MIDLTPVVQAVITLGCALITAFLVPYIKARTTQQTQDRLTSWVQVAVAAAEQLYPVSGKGADKKAYVLEFLAARGYTVDTDAIDAMIEAAVYDLTGGV